MGDKRANKKTGNRFQIVFYAILILFVLCIYWIDRTHESGSSPLTKTTPTASVQESPIVPVNTPLPYFSVDGLSAVLEKSGFVIMSAAEDSISLRDNGTGYRVRLLVRDDGARIESVSFTIPFSSSGKETLTQNPFADLQEKKIREDEAGLLRGLLSAIVEAADPYISGNAIPMISEWYTNTVKIRDTGKPYHAKVKGLELSAVYSPDSGGTIQIVMDLV